MNEDHMNWSLSIHVEMFKVMKFYMTPTRGMQVGMGFVVGTRVGRWKDATATT